MKQPPNLFAAGPSYVWTPADRSSPEIIALMKKLKAQCEARARREAEALADVLYATYPECRGEISFEYVGDLTYVVTAPSILDFEELRRVAQNVLPVTVRVEVKAR